jgi:mRNA-degrading endonuclease toxin of MazEF toxin-antitoxin module
MVYWCDLPRYEKNPNVQAGMRPVIIVSNNVANCLSNNITVVPCTTNIEKNPDQPTHTILELNKENPSLVLCEDIMTVNKDLLAGFMGMLDENVMKTIDKCLMAAIGLTEIPNPFDRPRVEKTTEEKLEEKLKSNRGRKLQTRAEKQEFITYCNSHTKEETAAEYGIPTVSAVSQRLLYYKRQLKNN